jgi:cyclic beta-1,2-glucan synthetase
MANRLGHVVMVTNRGLHTSCNGNAQQNRLTPDWPDIVTREVPAEAIYLYDPDRQEWYSPTYHPLNECRAQHEAAFGVDGTALFRMTHGTVSTELTVFVPPEDPVGIYLLTVRNHADHARRMRIAPYFQIVLSVHPEASGPLDIEHDRALNALFFENPRNAFRSGPAFASMSIAADRVETKRGRFFGKGRGVTHPFLVERGEPDGAHVTDDRPIAGFLGILELPAHGERTIAIILGQTDHRKHAAGLIRKYQRLETAQESLKQTRRWWLGLMGTVEVKTTQPAFDQLQNWLKYQTLVERLWARRGFYQTSGAFGFRDQLQDAVNLIWMDPALARNQIILHASHQFVEGDVFHWFFTLPDGRTAFASRSHASDNPLWLVWGVVEYLRGTGDDSILDERTSYVMSENPFQPLPKNKQGLGGLYQRSTRSDSVYRHCLKAIDRVLEQRMGAHGLPLMGTGDWNDGLDEIGSQGKGESVWLGFFLYYLLQELVNLVERKEGRKRKAHYLKKMEELASALERTWRADRYLRAIHDDGTEIGVKGSGVWETDALTAAWAVMAGLNPERGLIGFHTALRVLERENVVLLGWPALREDTTPYLGRSSKYPEGVRENGMYCHGVQWLIKAARILAERCERQGEPAKADEYRETAYRLWRKITPITHVTPQEIEIYGGQPNKQPADLLTTFDQGRMIWHGYTGAAGWLFREALEGVIGASLIKNELIPPADLDKPRGALNVIALRRDVSRRPVTSLMHSPSVVRGRGS